jgi:hypothetical protein
VPRPPRSGIGGANGELLVNHEASKVGQRTRGSHSFNPSSGIRQRLRELQLGQLPPALAIFLTLSGEPKIEGDIILL